MYLLLIILSVIILIHSLLFVFVIQKFRELSNDIEQLGRKKDFMSLDIRERSLSKKEKTRSNRSIDKENTKSMKRGSR